MLRGIFDSYNKILLSHPGHIYVFDEKDLLIHKQWR
jgi:hypothetical protein